MRYSVSSAKFALIVLVIGVVVAISVTIVARFQPAQLPSSNEQARHDWPKPEQPIVAAHYFGRHWATNFLAAFRRSDVPLDLRRIKYDGFNTVIFVVSWGDFQPGILPCCEYDERAFERLHYLLGAAADAGLQVVLRLGYTWTYRPEIADVGKRTQMLMNSESVRKAFLAYIERLARELKSYPHVKMSFLTWEDQLFYAVGSDGEKVLRRWHNDLGIAVDADASILPFRHDFPDPERFHAFWDWLAINEIYRPSKSHIPNLSYEVRVDKEPVYATNGAGHETVSRWISHDGMYDLPDDVPVTIYFAPFWGAENIGESITADTASDRLRLLLEETRDKSRGNQIFIDQFNFIDNTPGYEHNARIDHGQVAAFLEKSLCVMKNAGVMGYGIWTFKDYRESRLYNPAFGYGLDGWSVMLGDSAARGDVLVTLPGGDHALELVQGDSLSQTLTRARGRLPFRDARRDEVCIRGVALGSDAQVTASASQKSAGSVLVIPAGDISEVCGDLVAEPEDDRITFSLSVDNGAVMIYDLWFHDHVQVGGIYDEYGTPGPYHAAMTRLNRDFIQHSLPDYCPTGGAGELGSE